MINDIILPYLVWPYRFKPRDRREFRQRLYYNDIGNVVLFLVVLRDLKAESFYSVILGFRSGYYVCLFVCLFACICIAFSVTEGLRNLKKNQFG